MSIQRLRRWIARSAMVVGIAAAGLTLAAPVQAEPLWPDGPLWPGGPVVPRGPDIGTPAIIPAPPAPCSTEARACLRLSTNEAWLTDNGKTVYGPTPISHGMPGYETPPGVFRVFLKKPYHWSTMHHADMWWAIFFNGDIAFHVGPVDLPSHGCIRMTDDGAKAFYNYLNIGDVVEVVP